MGDEMVVLRVPAAVARAARAWLGCDAEEYDQLVAECEEPDTRFIMATRAALLRAEIPPERVPVTPDTPTGREIRWHYGRATYVAPVADDPLRFWAVGINKLRARQEKYGDGWFEVPPQPKDDPKPGSVPVEVGQVRRAPDGTEWRVIQFRPNGEISLLSVPASAAHRQEPLSVVASWPVVEDR